MIAFDAVAPEPGSLCNHPGCRHIWSNWWCFCWSFPCDFGKKKSLGSAWPSSFLRFTLLISQIPILLLHVFVYISICIYLGFEYDYNNYLYIFTYMYMYIYLSIISCLCICVNMYRYIQVYWCQCGWVFFLCHICHCVQSVPLSNCGTVDWNNRPAWVELITGICSSLMTALLFNQSNETCDPFLRSTWLCQQEFSIQQLSFDCDLESCPANRT